jgi:hypothetical protein
MADPAPPADPLPPTPPASVYRWASVGVALVAAAAVLGLVSGESGPSTLALVRLVLVAAGTLVAGCALSLRPNLPLAWMLAAAAAALAALGLPAHWDSIRMLARVAAGAATAGAILAAATMTVRAAIISVAALYHFFCIFMATTWPDPAPWFTQQVGTRYVLPYIQFVYLKNAYHFYSPEPGSASHLFFLIVYDKVDPKTGKPEAEWVTMPDRKAHWKDPMGLAYFRRLSLTEQASQSMPGISEQTAEWQEIYARRTAVTQLPPASAIPFSPREIDPIQYRMPRYDITRYLLPSYAAHLLRHHSTPDRKAKTVRIYRLEHPIPSLFEFSQREWNPHHPLGFKPYYYGEFALTPDGDAALTDKQDPMLYWLVPILPKVKGADGREFEDFMSKHAKYAFDWEGRTP